MAKKTLSELFNRYIPSAGRCAQLMRSAGDYTFRTNKEEKYLELRVCYDSIVTKRDLQALENEIRQAYQLNYVHIIPRYRSELFTKNYIDEMLIELQRRGAVAHGFFYDYDYEVDMAAHTVTVKIGFSNGGIVLLYNDDTPQIAEQILRDEFDINYTVSIVRDDNVAKKVEEFNAGLARAEEERQVARLKEEMAKTIQKSLLMHLVVQE